VGNADAGEITYKEVTMNNIKQTTQDVVDALEKADKVNRQVIVQMLPKESDVIRMAREAGIEWDLIDKNEGQIWYITRAGLERFAALVAAAEREACAKVCDELVVTDGLHQAKYCANAIRARDLET
jgi:hypothetical protein